MLRQIPRRDSWIHEFSEHMLERLQDVEGKDDQERVRNVLSDLSQDEARIVEEETERCFSGTPQHIRYYLENYHVINTAGENAPAHLQTMYPFRSSQEVLWEDFEECWRLQIPVRWICLKARRAGWSTMIGALIFNRTIAMPLTNSMILADERVRAEWIFNMSRLAYDNLPYWLRPEVSNEIKGTELRFDRFDKKERRLRPGLQSCLYVDAANKPSGAGRGMGFEHLHATEVSRYNNSRILTSDLLPTLPENNPYSIQAMEGTAEGHGYFFHNMWKDTIKGLTTWRPVFTGWWKEKRYSRPFATAVDRELFTPDEEERALVTKVKDEFQYDISKEQLNWRRKKRAEFEASEGDPDKVEQEYPSYPESAWRVQGSSYFPKRQLGLIEKAWVRPPKFAGDLECVKAGKNGTPSMRLIGYPGKDFATAPLWIWEQPRSKCSYYLGADPGHGVPGKDYSTISIWRIPARAQDPLFQVAEYQGYVGGTMFAKLIDMLGRFYNTCEIAPECNQVTEVIADLLNVHEYPKIYRFQRPDKVRGRFTNYFGWLTHVTSRNNIITRFRTMIIQDRVIIRSSRLLDECYTFVDDGTGKFCAAEHSHDDVLFSAMIACYCMLESEPTMVAAQTVSEEKPQFDYQNSDYSPDYDGPRGSSAGTPDYDCL